MKAISLVLLPGMDGSGRLFAPLLRALPDWVQPVVVSYPPDQALDYKGHLEIVMAALPADQPFVLLGESFSGPLALMAAARHPRGLRGVMLCASFIAWPLPLPVFVARVAVRFGVFHFKFRRILVRILLSKHASEEIRALFAEALVRLKPEVLAARAQAIMGLDCRAELGACRVPVFVMVADHDRIVSGRCAELMHKLRPDVEMVHFNSPHLILQFDPLEAAKAICGFLKTANTTTNHEIVAEQVEVTP